MNKVRLEDKSIKKCICGKDKGYYYPQYVTAGKVGLVIVVLCLSGLSLFELISYGKLRGSLYLLIGALVALAMIYGASYLYWRLRGHTDECSRRYASLSLIAQGP